MMSGIAGSSKFPVSLLPARAMPAPLPPMNVEAISCGVLMTVALPEERSMRRLLDVYPYMRSGSGAYIDIGYDQAG